MLLIAHRGGSGFGDDNTLHAMELAAREGVRMIETDIRMTSDNELVICHDATVRGHVVSRMTLDDLKKHVPERPLLKEVLEELAGWITFNIEVKDASMRMLAEELTAYRVETSTLVSSFDSVFLEGFKEMYPRIKTGHIYRMPYGRNRKIDRAMEIGAQVIIPHYGSVDQTLIDEAHEFGLEVYSWTVNDQDDFKKLFDWGVDGVITDCYLEMRELLASLSG